MRARLAAFAVVFAAGCAPPTATFEPSVVYVEGAFGYDPVADAAVAYTSEGTEVPPTITLMVASDAWFDTQADADRCAVVLRHDGGEPIPRAPWAAEADAWFGFDLPSTATVESSCTGWDPADWGDDPAGALAALGWGIGISDLDPDVEDEVRAAVIETDGQATWDDGWAPIVFGAGFRWSGSTERFDGGFAPNDYGFALTVDAQYATIVQEGSFVPLPVEDVGDGTPPAAAYVLRRWFGLGADLVAPTNL